MSTAPRHWLDRLSSIPMGIPRLYEPIFSGGWGDETVIDAVRSVSAAPPDPPDVDIRWEAHADDSRVGTLIGVDRHRPRDIPPARILQIAPTERRQVILMAASNDHGWQTRSTVAGHLAQAGIGSVILEQPFYGTRRRHAGQPIRTVSEFFLMGAVAVEEARAIMRHLHRAGHVVGVGGFSQGGSMASHVSALAPVPVATACLAAGPSPGPVFTAPGVLASTVDWEALGGRQRAEDRLARLLGDIDATRYPPPDHAASAVLAGARADAYVTPDEVERLWRHWPGSELAWVEGGHATFHLLGRRTQAWLIERAFERFMRSGRA